MVANITIHSVIENLDGTGEAERTHTEVSGELSLSSSGANLAWREGTESGEVESLLTVSGDTVAVVRRGAIENSFTFKEGVRNESLYKIGPYSFDSSVTARRVKCALSSRGMSVTVIYEMELGGEARLVKMKIRAEACEAEDCHDGD